MNRVSIRITLPRDPFNSVSSFYLESETLNPRVVWDRLGFLFHCIADKNTLAFFRLHSEIFRLHSQIKKNTLLFLLLFKKIFLAVSCGMWNLSSLTRDWTSGPCIGSARILTTGPPGKSHNQTFGSGWRRSNMKKCSLHNKESFSVPVIISGV